MRVIVAVCCILALAAAAPAPAAKQAVYYPQEQANLLRFENENYGTGSYRYGFEQSDGTKQEQQGELINEGREDESIVVKGFYSWVSPNGVTYIVKYVADQNGYQPEIEEGPGALPPGLQASLLG